MTIETEANPDTSRKSVVRSFLEAHWGSAMIASRGKLIDASSIPRVLALNGSEIYGLATYVIDDSKHSCELVSLDAAVQGKGIGTAIIKEVERQAKLAGCDRIWLITTNTNPEAATFYVKNGYRLMAVHLDALKESRELKPQIPMTDERGIPLMDEWEFAKQL